MVVVLPASMWAMMPMLRRFRSGFSLLFLAMVVSFEAGRLCVCQTLKPWQNRNTFVFEGAALTYKKAIRVCSTILAGHGLALSRTVQKQVGYLVLFGTEGEVSKGLHHQLKAVIQNLPCGEGGGSLTDEAFEVAMERYAEQLERENPEGGEISLGWLLKEARDKELWEAFAT